MVTNMLCQWLLVVVHGYRDSNDNGYLMVVNGYTNSNDNGYEWLFMVTEMLWLWCLMVFDGC